ncbi:MAG: hypothetical protein IH900_14945 [Proteobacteria bacterium]|nr:hypothetical protein [Pseudomonadota bacterium]
MDIGIQGADLLGGLEAVEPGREIKVYEGNHERLARVERHAHRLDGLASLMKRDQINFGKPFVPNRRAE